MAGCAKHPFDPASAECRRCRQPFCDECLVHVAGKKKATCVSCTLVAAGVRRPKRAGWARA